MDALTFIATLVKATVWPAVVGYALYLFRINLPSALNDLLSRLKTAKGAGLELAFGEKLDKVEQLLPPPNQTVTIGPIESKIVLGSATMAVDDPSSTSTETEKLLTATEINKSLPPSYIVSQAWLRLEDEMRLYLGVRGADTKDLRLTSISMIKRIANDGLFSKEELAQFMELRDLRNQVAHDVHISITLTDALRYNDIINGLIERLRSKRLPPLP